MAGLYVLEEDGASSVLTVLTTPCSGLLPRRVLEFLSVEMHMRR